MATTDPSGKLTPEYEIEKRATPEGVNKGGYYGIPILKRPFWKWEIALYFFFEGVSAGSFLLCSAAEFAGGRKYGDLIRKGRYLSLATLLPCLPLLIVDLGRPERFHHMLRIFKKTSPMNHGAWALTGYGTFAALAAGLEFLGGAGRRVAAVLGAPFAFTMVSYPGVLLSTTSIPVWAHTHVLGALIASSSMSSAASALTLLSAGSDDEVGHRALAKFEDMATAAEAIALGAYLKSAKQAVRPLLKGKQSKLFLWGAIGAGIVLPFLLRRSKSKLASGVIAPSLAIAGSAALKWSITYAGQESATDVDLAVHNAR
jgi:formate-dependent nitrite reductase membrane component NrfD